MSILHGVWRSTAVVRSTVMDGDAAMDMKNTTIN
jgi:hypothetical protein